MVEFILARYNYWIVIILMMTGLYIVFSRGNLVKTLVGLNLFQTSVFIFYITIGYVAGGTAPILIGGGEKKDDHHHNGHPHDDHHGADHDHAHGDHSGRHSIDQSSPLSHEEATAFVQGERANALDGNRPGGSPVEEAKAHEGSEGSLHTLPEVGAMPEGERTGAASNSLFSSADQSSPPSDAQRNIDRFDVDVAAATPSPRSENIVEATADILYSNPLPHVLILTAIVVGVATTAVGLAIAVRIREAYGTIEEDALEQMDNQAEFGGTAPQSDEGSRA